jgi:hypothetical protein
MWAQDGLPDEPKLHTSKPADLAQKQCLKHDSDGECSLFDNLKEEGRVWALGCKYSEEGPMLVLSRMGVKEPSRDRMIST